MITTIAISLVALLIGAWLGGRKQPNDRLSLLEMLDDAGLNYTVTSNGDVMILGGVVFEFTDDGDLADLDREES